MRRIFILLSAAFIVSCQSQETQKRVVGVTADKAMVVSAHPLASKVGADIMKKGGNAVDAAIAVQFALAVTYPVAGNIGGGGFMVARFKDGSTAALDYREKAPAAASTNMYIGETGEAISDLSKKGHLASGICHFVQAL